VAIVDSTTIENFMAEAERVVAGGVRAIGLANGVPPDGKSPGHPDLDPMWRFFTEHKIPLLFHGGGDFGIWRHYQWINYGFDAEQWGQGSRQDNPEILDPYTIAQLAVGMQNFLTTMVYGGVFERHPDLHVGCIEMSGGWIGPMAENMDVIADLFPTRLGKVLSTKPSEYIQRNVRVSAYFWEPVDKYIERYELDNVFVFASDYPHWEGGKDPVNREAEKLRRLGSTMLEKFFVSNPSVLMA
jgi:predicted TIM-barrel fold metal-dependent hydrolase